MSDKTKAAAKSKGGFFDTVKTILIAVAIALVIRTVAYEPFSIPSGSMKPTLQVGDYLFVSKFAYGYSRFSMPFSPPVFDGRILADAPERGDVAVFKLPSDNSTDYIKRVIGLPGDRIQVREGVLHINGEAVEREKVRTEGDGPTAETIYRETLPNGHTHLIREMSDQAYYDNTRVFEVPEGHYFMMGDNRDASQDSRVLSKVGYVPFENLVGRASFIFFSYEESVALWEVWAWPTAVRFGRMFNDIV
ncbi:signal peptidase I Serine peptidase. MEROPS family S26A [Limimonas halophila]|uniref:Signal peptidase I n=1 Tax=Limimonas halophila TaxID=1082479 RepID=A0A1G7P1I7_9PROT|nr:signal peptidase I [Limimonas halophila]SDF80123.1 signal peptidase I Serine peptidase. MEROPS family S26A [Limimonas halophila]